MKKRLGLMTLSLMMVSPALAGGAGQPASTPAACKSIADIVSTDEQFGALLTAVQSAGLVDELKALGGSYTLFAPTNAAFAKVPSDQLATLLNDPELLSSVILYHLVAEKATAAELRGASSGTTEQGADIQITTSGNMVMINNARVVKADIQACNGVIHAIDTVLIPPATEAAAPAAAPEAAAPAAPAPEAAAPAPEAAPAAAAPAAEATTVPNAVDITSIPALPLSGATINTAAGAATTETSTEAVAQAPAPETSTEATTETTTEAATTETATTTETTTETATAEASTETTVAQGNTIYDLIVADERFSTLRDLLSDAGLTDTLLTGEYTLFAPTDDAFAALPEGTLAALASDPEALKALLLYHVVSGKLTAEQVAAGNLQTAAGTTLTVSANLSPVIETSNGLIYPVDAVLLPAGFTAPVVEEEAAAPAELATATVADVATALAGPEFSTLRGLLEKAGLLATVTSGEYTIFAPTNDAFAALPAGVADALTDEQLKALLSYHVVPGRVTLEQVNGDTEIKTVQGTALILGNAEPQSVVTAGNSTIYVVNGVLFPADFKAPDLPSTDTGAAPATATTATTTTTTVTTTPAPATAAPATAAPAAAAPAATATPGTAAGGAIAGGNVQSPVGDVAAALSDPRLSTLRDLLTQANLVGTLTSGAYTIFAPTNDAFAKVPQATLDALKADSVKLKQVLLYHVVSGTPGLDALIANPLTTVEGSPLTVTRAAAGLSFDGLGNTLDGGTALSAGTSSIYLIDTVLLPPALR